MVAEPAPELEAPVAEATPEPATAAVDAGVDVDAEPEVEAESDDDTEAVTVPEDSEVAPKRVPVKSKKATTARKPATKTVEAKPARTLARAAGGSRGRR